MLSVGDCITNDTFEEGLENTTGLFVDHYIMLELNGVEVEHRGEHTGRDTLDTATACETTDGWLGDTYGMVC